MRLDNSPDNFGCEWIIVDNSPEFWGPVFFLFKSIMISSCKGFTVRSFVNKLSEYSEKKDKHIAGGPGKISTSKLLLLCGEVATKQKIKKSHVSS
jgi:hypothetical protein